MTPKSRKQRIYDLLTTHLSPEQLFVEDESNQHSRPGVETHFKIIAVASFFENQKSITRHRQINTWLADELKTGLHALSLNLYTPAEWAKHPHAPATPACQSKT